MQATTRKKYCNLCLHLFQDRLLRLKIASTILLVIYLSIWLKPLFPYIDFELNRDYIIKTLCVERDKKVNTCQGNCHLNKEIEENSTGETNDQNRVPPQSFESEIFYISLSGFNAPQPGTVKGSLCLYFSNYKFLLHSNHFHPPEFA